MANTERSKVPTALHRSVSFISAAVILAALTGCGSLRSDRNWGEHAFRPATLERIPAAAKNALLDPVTWVPLIGAGVIAAGGWDHSISDWASRETPLYGSKNGAENFSDAGRDILIGEAFGTMLLTPSGSSAGEWAWNKTKGAGVEAGAFLFTDFTTREFKEAIGRKRPDKRDAESMPSGHASSAFSGMALANRNLDYIDMNPYGRTGLKAANVALATTVSWARVEGQKHFPTDVLVGAAVGNFLTRFIYDAFLGLDADDRFSLYLEPASDGGKAFLSWSF